MRSLWPVSGEPDEVVRLLADWLERDDPRPLLVETSGSTGAAKRVRLSRDALVASATATHARLGGPGRWTLLLPPTYVAGLQVVVRSLLAGHAPAHGLDVPEGRGYVSVVPTQLVRLLRDPEQTRALAAHAAVLVGGGPVDPELRKAAGRAGVRAVATYGMSETCGGCVYDGVPLDGVEVRVGEDDGLVRIRGPVLYDGYDDRPAELADGWFVTSDLGEIVDGRLRVLGRADDVVNSGGVKVPAAAVARRLRAHPGVDAAEVLGLPDPEWGERVVAFVVGATTDLEVLRDWVAVAHPRAWAPRQVVALDALPVLGDGRTGKPDRRALRELA